MKLRDYWTLFADAPTVARTIGTWRVAPALVGDSRALGGQLGAVARHIHPTRLRVRVSGRRWETDDAVTLTLTPIDCPLPAFLPGQYVNVFVSVGGVHTSRPLSISSSPSRRGMIDLTVKRKPLGFVSPHLTDVVEVGDTLTITGAEGDFHFHPARDTDDLVLIAGGVGITPFMGMIEHLLEARPQTHMLLIYGSSDADRIIFAQRLARLAAEHPDRLAVVHVIERPRLGWLGETGLIDARMLQRLIGSGDLGRKTFFLCGPHAMMVAVQGMLADMGVARRRVRQDCSAVRTDVVGAPGWPPEVDPLDRFTVRIPNRGVVLEVMAGENLMSSLERGGVLTPAICRVGTCGSCLTRLIEGQAYVPPEVAVRRADREAGYIHTCTTYPLSDMVLRPPFEASRRSRSLAAGTI
jgi:ferredoxin-NADP reductase